MNNLNKDDLHKKLIEKRLGRLDAQESVDLDALIQSDDGIKTQWEDVSSLVEEYGDSPDLENGWLRLESSLLNSKRKTWRKISKIAIVAASVILILLVVGIMKRPNNIGSALVSTSSKPANKANQLRLILSNGQTISLQQSQNILLNNGMQITNDSATRQLALQGKGEVDSELNTLEVPPGLDYNIILPDGTQVLLNSSTTLKFPFRFGSGKREVAIDGEAYLKVAHDASKPFVVHLRNVDVCVLGTEFNINTYGEEKKVSLVRGSVMLSTNKDSMSLHPGFAMGWQDQKVFKTMALNPDDIAWIEGKYVLNNTSVTEIARLIPRWFGVKVVIDNPTVANKLFNGVIYKNKPLAGLINLLEGTMDLECYYSGNVLHFK